MAKPSFKVTSRSTTFKTPWLDNAARSIGISTKNVLKDISPNVMEVVESGVSTSRNIVNSLRRNNTSTNRVGDALKRNKYVQYMQKAYKNAFNDLKEGNLNNVEREQGVIDETLGENFDSSGFSFGDDGADEGGSKTINVYGGGNNEAMLSQMRADTKAQLTVQKASMDAMIAIHATNMQQFSQLGNQILNKLDATNGYLKTMQEFQAENTAKFIQASLAYYEKMGTLSDNGRMSSDRVAANDVLKPGGGVSWGRYKEYIKQNIKDNPYMSTIQQVLNDEDFINSIVANPLGKITEMTVSAVMPQVLKTSMAAVEKTFNSFVPAMLVKLGDLAEDTSFGVIGSIKRFIGQTFGIRNGHNDEAKMLANINRDAIPFDGETKHAITQLITKELRLQTGYLEIIANKYSDGKARDIVNKGTKIWNYESNSYKSVSDIDTAIADRLVDAIRTSFENTDFGKVLRSDLIDTRIDEESQKEMAFTLDELFVEIEKQKGRVELSDLISLIEHGGGSATTKEIIKKYVSKMAQENANAFNSLNTARVMGQGELTRAIKEIQDNYGTNNLLDSAFYNANVDEVLAMVKGFGRDSSGNARSTNNRDILTMGLENLDAGARVNTQQRGMEQRLNNLMYSIYGLNPFSDYSNTPQANRMVNGIRETGTTFANFFSSLAHGDKEGALGVLGSSMSKAFTTIGKKLEDFAKDENGLLFQVKSNIKDITTTIEDGVMFRLFGKSRDENGKFVKAEDSDGGIFGKISSGAASIFKQGFDGWMDAFFGDEGLSDEDKEERNKRIIGSIKDTFKGGAASGITGSLIGAGIGMMAKGSVLGTLVGGPIGGAILGAAGGFLSRNEKFQNWLFGEKDENGERVGGVISKKIQDFAKEHKKGLVGGGAIGLVTGTITGGGLLGTLVGGPIAGSLLGMAGYLASQSKTIKTFLYGDEENGVPSFFGRIANAFNRGKGGRGGDGIEGAGKKTGMALLGMGGGAITAGLLSKLGVLGASLSPLGPIGGAIAGLALSIKAQGGNFKQWLFGEEKGLELGDGRKVKKQGVLGQIANTMMANIFRPMKHQIEYIGKDLVSTIKGKVLAPFSILAEYTAENIGRVMGDIAENVKTGFSKVVTGATNMLKELFQPFTSAIGKTLTTATNVVWGALKKVMSFPGEVIFSTVKALDITGRIKRAIGGTKVVKFVKSFATDFKNLVFDLTKQTFKGIFNVATAPFKLLGLGLKGGWDLTKRLAGWAGDKIKNSRLGTAIADRVNASKAGGVLHAFGTAFNRWRYGDTLDEGDMTYAQRINRINDSYMIFQSIG